MSAEPRPESAALAWMDDKDRLRSAPVAHVEDVLRPRLVSLYGRWENASGTAHDPAAWYRLLIAAAQAEASSLDEIVALCAFAYVERVTDYTPEARAALAGGWVPDVLRHTAISHYFRATGSYGRTAEQFGNSESIIKKHYQSRVSSKDTKRFYALRPLPAKPAKTKQKRAGTAKRTPKATPAAANVVALPVQAAA